MMNRVARCLTDNVHLNRGRLVGHLYLGSTLTERVSRWPDNSPNNVGHRRDLIAVVVLLDRVRAWLPKGNRRTPLGKSTLIPANTEVVRSWTSGTGNDLERLKALFGSFQSR